MNCDGIVACCAMSGGWYGGLYGVGLSMNAVSCFCSCVDKRAGVVLYGAYFLMKAFTRCRIVF
jgi:hypothetical protein